MTLSTSAAAASCSRASFASRARVPKGGERAKPRGVVMGVSRKLTHHKHQKACRRDADETPVGIARTYTVSHSQNQSASALTRGSSK